MPTHADRIRDVAMANTLHHQSRNFKQTHCHITTFCPVANLNVKVKSVGLRSRVVCNCSVWLSLCCVSPPQVELHVHLDGAIRVQTILDVAEYVETVWN